MHTQTLLHIAPHTVTVRDTELPALQAGQLRVEVQASAIGAGVESLIFAGAMPENWAQDDPPRLSGGDFRYPFSFGSALVGQVVQTGSAEDRDWLGRRVFARHAHQGAVLVASSDCRRVPDDMPGERALFLAEMESALGLVFDSAPMAGERVMVFGQGVTGLLATAILAEFPLGELITADPVAVRRERSMELGAALAIDPGKGRELAVLEDCLFFGDNNGLDLAIEVSGQVESLNQAVKLTGIEGRIVLGSWYGRHSGPVDLGGCFHRRRQRLIASPMGIPNLGSNARWSPERRLKLILEWLDRVRPERFITHRFPLSASQEAFELAVDKQVGALQVVFEYP